MPNSTNEPKPTGLFALIEDIFNRFFDFIDKYFQTMNIWVRTTVYLGFVIFIFFIAFVVAYYTFLRKPAEPTEVEVSGQITLRNHTYIPDTLMYIELAGKDLYVNKKQPFDRSTQFIYEWLMKVKKENLYEPMTIALLKYDQVRGSYSTRCYKDIIPNDFFPSTKKPMPHLEVDPSFVEIKCIIDTPAERGTVGHSGILYPSLFPVAMAQSTDNPQIKSISADSANILYQTYINAKSPIRKMQLKKKIRNAGDPYMLMIADSLKHEVMHEHKDKIADYAQILANFNDIGQLSSSGIYANIFTDHFYRKAVVSLRSTDENESRSIALFLKNMQDARCLQYIFQEYSNAKTTLAKRLHIFVLEGFSTNQDVQIKERVINWLHSKLQNEQSSEIRDAIQDAINGFISK